MSPDQVGQRCVSEPEPELGLGLVESVANGRIGVSFPATGERRLYALGTSVLKRVQFRVGQTIASRDGRELQIDAVEENAGVLTYVGGGRRLPEAEVADLSNTGGPLERLMAGQTDENEVFDLRFRVLQQQARLRASPVRGYLGGRLELIPHQFYVAQEVTGRQLPRVLLADEVGLGKTIEACLIMQRLLTVGRVKRALVLVPESLTHQWFVELLRRFNLWFSIFDEARCLDEEAAEPGENPFLSDQLALCSVDFPAQDETRFAQVIAGEWDMVVVDEAHHLAWSPDPAGVGRTYQLVEQLARRSPGLLLLTATPTQLGREGHFARLRLLDPDRYADFDRFVAETETFGVVAAVAEKIVEGKPLKPADQRTLKRIFNRDPAGLAEHLAALDGAKPGAREALLRTLLDQYGPGRVMLRNTRSAMTGFPPRRFCPVPLEAGNPTLQARVARELEAEETGHESELRYNFKEDPRLDWLVEFLTADPARKVLLICRSHRKVAALDAALQTRINVKSGLFHEGLPLVQRDRQAAWFAEPDGAQLLLCSEIGSEGRNFQFAHHLVLFDLPLNPGLVEQRIGRLDRIGQSETICLHVPYLADTAQAAVVAWYDRGIDAFRAPLHGGSEYEQAFKTRLLDLVHRWGGGKKATQPEEIESLINETATFRVALQEKLQRGRDRLLELNSFDPRSAAVLIEQVRAVDGDLSWRRALVALLDHFGVRVKEHEEGDVFLDADRAYVEGFPTIPRDGMLATFDRRRAIAREDIRFVSPDHGLVQDTFDLLLNSPAGSTAFGLVEGDGPDIWLEVIFVVEVIADSRWHVDQFLAPQPVRVLVNLRGEDLGDEWDAQTVAETVKPRPLADLLELPGFNLEVVKGLLEGATERAERAAGEIRREAGERARETLRRDRQRLVDLQKLNDHVRPEEVALAQARLEQTVAAIGEARLRVDALRLLLVAAG